MRRFAVGGGASRRPGAAAPVEPHGRRRSNAALELKGYGPASGSPQLAGMPPSGAVTSTPSKHSSSGACA